MDNSNTIWTDKETARWFVIQLHGHEGPYSLSDLEKNYDAQKLSGNASVWCEGLEKPMTLFDLLRGRTPPKRPMAPPPLPTLPMRSDDVDDAPPPPFLSLPSEEEVPPLPTEAMEEQKKKLKLPVVPAAIIFAVILLSFFLRQWIQSREEFVIQRPSKMGLELQEKIKSMFSFEGWDREIFFREFVSTDLSRIWLVTSGFQSCDVEATFLSLKDKLLAQEDTPIQFKASGKLKNHLVEFSTFEFVSGHKIVPGLYEMDVRAQGCHWGTFTAKLANFFTSPEEEYRARMKVVLYSKGAEEFQRVLGVLVKKKELEAKKKFEAREAFWGEVQQKIQTLDAIASQIETFFNETLAKDPNFFTKTMKDATQVYTKKFGHTLTRFVVSNEEDFKKMTPELRQSPKALSYEQVVKLSAKNLGFESMKFIEELQALKKPTRSSLDKIKGRVQIVFQKLHEDLNQKVLQVSEDRRN